MATAVEAAPYIQSPRSPVAETVPAWTGYERLSNDRSLRGINVAIQRDEIDDNAAEAGRHIFRHFSDNHISASEFGSKPRDEYIELLACIMRSLVLGIMVTEVPRLCRQSEEALELIRLSKTTPFRYVATTDDMVYDLHTPRGRKAFREAVSDAEFESDQSSSRQHRKKNNLASAGAFHGGQRPYAYEGARYEKLVTDDGKEINGVLLNPGRVGRVIIEKEAAIRRECTQRITIGELEIDLVRDLNARRIPAPDGGKWRASNLKRFLLRKRDVAFDVFPGKGTRVHKGTEYRAVWDAIISKEDYELMVAALKLRSSARTARGAGRTYLLSTIVRCTHEHCGPGGGPMYGKGTQSRGKYIRRYGCRSQNSYGERIVGPKTYRKAEDVDQFVREAVIERFNTPEVADALAPHDDKPRVRQLVEQQTKQKLHLQGLAADYGAGVLSRDDLVIAKQAAQQTLNETENELAKLQSARAASAIPAGQTVASFMDTASLELQRKVILLLVDHVVILPSSPHCTTPREMIKIVWRV